VLFIGCKPYSATINTPNGWTPITNTSGTNGTTANGTDVGSVAVAAFYRIWQTGDGNPTISITSGNTALACIHRFRPTAGSTINTPVGHRGSDTSSGTGYAATMGSDIGITVGDAVVSYTFIAGNNSTFGTPTLSATGVTFGTVTENPATEGSTTTGLDSEASASTALPSAGPSSAAAVVGWTLSVAQTGMSDLIRIREIANHALTANGITASPVLATSTISQNHALTGNGLTTTPVLATSTLTQIHALTANGLATGAPVLSTSTFHNNHALTANGLTAGAPTLATPTIALSYFEIQRKVGAGSFSTLSTATGPATRSFVDDDTFTGGTTYTYRVRLVTDGVAGDWSNEDAVAYVENYALTANGITVSPVLATPAITQAHALTATGIIASPILGTPAISQTHALTATGLSTTPVLATPTLTQIHVLTANGITTTPVLGHPTVAEEGGTNDALTANPLTLGAPALGASTLAQVHALSSAGITAGAPALANAVFNQVCALVANGVATGLPSLGVPQLAQIHALVATGIIAGPPTLSTPIFDGGGTDWAHVLQVHPWNRAQPALEISLLASPADIYLRFHSRRDVYLPGGTQ
jgi:hypothetical protein